MFLCRKCKQVKSPLILGDCIDCSPQSHDDHQFASDVMREMFAEFKDETGVDPMCDWGVFEDFLAKRLETYEGGERFVCILENREARREVILK